VESAATVSEYDGKESVINNKKPVRFEF